MQICEKRIEQKDIAFAHKWKADTSYWDAEIDTIVYKLYNLTDEEIKIVEEG